MYRFELEGYVLEGALGDHAMLTLPDGRQHWLEGEKYSDLRQGVLEESAQLQECFISFMKMLDKRLTESEDTGH